MSCGRSRRPFAGAALAGRASHVRQRSARGRRPRGYRNRRPARHSPRRRAPPQEPVCVVGGGVQAPYLSKSAPSRRSRAPQFSRCYDETVAVQRKARAGTMRGGGTGPIGCWRDMAVPRSSARSQRLRASSGDSRAPTQLAVTPRARRSRRGGEREAGSAATCWFPIQAAPSRDDASARARRSHHLRRPNARRRKGGERRVGPGAVALRCGVAGSKAAHGTGRIRVGAPPPDHHFRPSNRGVAALPRSGLGQQPPVRRAAACDGGCLRRRRSGGSHWTGAPPVASRRVDRPEVDPCWWTWGRRAARTEAVVPERLRRRPPCLRGRCPAVTPGQSRHHGRCAAWLEPRGAGERAVSHPFVPSRPRAGSRRCPRGRATRTAVTRHPARRGFPS